MWEAGCGQRDREPGQVREEAAIASFALGRRFQPSALLPVFAPACVGSWDFVFFLAFLRHYRFCSFP